MDFETKKVTEIDVASTVANDLKVVITETVTENGEEIEAVRRISPSVMLAGSHYTKQQVDELLSNITYKPINISSFSVVPSVNELGSTVNDVTFSWASNKAPLHVEIQHDGISEALQPDQTNVTLENMALSSNKTFTLYMTDEKGANASKSVTVYFYNSVYWGAGAAWNGISGLTRVISGRRDRTIQVNAGTGQYIWYAIPASYGTPSFKVGGFDGGFTLYSTQNITNASGHTESYNIYRSDNHSLGNTTVIVA